MEKLPQVPMTEVTGPYLDGCIEDRHAVLFIPNPLETEDTWTTNSSEFEVSVELRQIPGASIFFSYAKDVIAEMENPNSVTHKLVDTVTDDAQTLRNNLQETPEAEREYYVVHNDESHGEEEDGCGFAAKIIDISLYLRKNIESILEDANISAELDKQSAREMAQAAGRLADNKDYMETIGGELVKKAVEAGAALLTYTGDHTASSLNISTNPNETYSSQTANSTDNEYGSSFNVDADTKLAEKSEKLYGIDGKKAVIFARILSIATTRVLGAEGAVTHN